MKWKDKKRAFGCCLMLIGTVLTAQSNLHVEGMGMWQNRSLKNRLAFLQNLEADQPAKLDAALIEDSAFLLIEQLKRDGYLRPAVEAELLGSDGARRVRWTSPYTIQLEAYVVAEAVTFRIKPGELAYYKEVEIEGVSAIEAEELQRFFIPGGVLLQSRRAKVFTPENLDRRAGRVVQSLEALGFREAQVIEQTIDFEAESGAVDVSLEFDQGPRHYIGGLTLLTRKEGAEDEEAIQVEPDTLLTRDWEQTVRNTYRNEAFAAGYPDAEVILQKEAVAEQSDTNAKFFDIRIMADWGEPATVGRVLFEGDEATRRATLRDRFKLEPGDPLDRLEVDKARRRLMGLGIFKHVSVDLRPDAGSGRDVVYSLEPGLRRKLQLLGGWGSYEQARLGFKWEHRNPFGRAHRYEVDAKQSLKSTLGEVSYYVPQVFGSNILLYSNMEYNYREEITHERTRWGTSFGGSYTTSGGLRLAMEYGFFLEEAERDNALSFQSEEDATVASVSLSASYDQRDDLLAPRSGYSVYGELEFANRLLGGSVDFQKVEIGGSYHFPLTGSTLVHLGLRGGTIVSTGAAERNIPFNERFFPGGENSVRGYREGEASPLDADGDQIGAESYALLNLELEQRVYSKFSALVFYDSTYHARDGFGSTGDLLHSLGLGLRYQTPVGPARLEYGHNLNPREADSDGTLHFSIGFPF